MYGVYNSLILHEETILNRCDNSILTVTCFQHLYRVDCSQAVVEAGKMCKYVLV